MSLPHRIAQISFSTSSYALDNTDEFPMFALTLTRKFLPMIIGSDSGWLTLFGIMASPLAT